LIAVKHRQVVYLAIFVKCPPWFPASSTTSSSPIATRLRFGSGGQATYALPSMALLPGFEYDIFISYRHNDNLDGWVTAISSAKTYFPELMGDSIVISEDNVFIAFDLFLLYKQMGESRKSMRLGAAFYNSKEVPKDTMGLENGDVNKKSLYMCGLVTQGKIDQALEIYANMYFVEKSKAHIFINRKDFLQLELSKSLNYKKVTATIDQDINKMRSEVVAYLKEAQQWNGKWK
jgi:hypothetical protein